MLLGLLLPNKALDGLSQGNSTSYFHQLFQWIIGKPRMILPETGYKHAVTYQHFQSRNQYKVMQDQPIGPKVAADHL